jgi:hypothetical protein
LRHHAPRTLVVHAPAEPRAGEHGVKEDPRLHGQGAVRAVLVERQEERHPPDEMRRNDPHEKPSLAMRLPDEPDVAEPQVAETAVDQLRRRAGRGAREVALVHERDPQPMGAGRLGDPRADDPAADDEQVEPLRRETLERVGTVVGVRRHRAIVVAAPRTGVSLPAWRPR